MVGGHHEDEEEEDILHENESNMMYMGRDETFKQQKLEEFENAARKILSKKIKVSRGKHEHIPLEIKVEFDLPEDIGNDYVNFDQVIRSDCSRKRKTPTWSGQDVL